MATRLKRALLLNWLLLLLLAHSTTELAVGVAHVKRGLLRLHILRLLLLLAELIEASLLRLLLEALTVTTVTILEACLLLLHTSGLRVCVVEEAGILGLLLRLLLIHQVAKPINLSLLLVSLVIASRLVLGWLCGRITKEQICVRLFQLSPAQLLLFLAELDCLREIVVAFRYGVAFPALPLLLSLVLAGLKGKLEFEVLVVAARSPLTALSSWPMRPLAVSCVVARVFFNASDARLPRFPVGSLGAQSFFVHDQRGKLFSCHSHCPTLASPLLPESFSLTVLTNIATILIGILELSQCLDDVDVLARPCHNQLGAFVQTVVEDLERFQDVAPVLSLVVQSLV